MLRRSFRILSAISLILCLAVAGLWMRSYWVGESIGRASKHSVMYAQSSRGIVIVGDMNDRGRGLIRPSRVYERSNEPAQIADPNSRIGFYFSNESAFEGVMLFRSLQFPHWFLVLLFGLLPTTWLISTTRSRRRRLLAGQCMRCGYDLRASPERCPECGKDVDPRMDTNEHESESARAHS